MKVSLGSNFIYLERQNPISDTKGRRITQWREEEAETRRRIPIFGFVGFVRTKERVISKEKHRT